MTKQRPPLSIDAALARIAGTLPGGWADMARIAARAEVTVRKWGDQDQPEQIPMPAAISLDIAYQAAGGDGAPIFETYALLLEVAKEKAFASQLDLQRHGCDLVRESAQAVEAIFRASMPGAGPAERERAQRELQDLDQMIPAAIATLRSAESGP